MPWLRIGVSLMVLLVVSFVSATGFAEAPSDPKHAKDGEHKHHAPAMEGAKDHHDDHHHDDHHNPYPLPDDFKDNLKQYQANYFMCAPFVILLLCIALLPLIHKFEHWWENNWNRLLVGTVLGAITLIYYGFFHDFYTSGHGGQLVPAGLPAVKAVLAHAIVVDYIPFMALLFSLYVISGGIQLRGDLPAHPGTNTAFLAIGGAIASFIGTTGAAMLLIRPLLSTNSERKHVVHTVIFFIFIVCNCGGLLLPIGDPPLFLGFLRGVDFFWTMNLWPFWLVCNILLLIVYFLWDLKAYKKETVRDIVRDEVEVVPLQLRGKFNFVLLAGVVFCTITMVEGEDFMDLGWFTVPKFMCQVCQLLLAGLSLYVFTPRGLREEVKFDYVAIGEVGALFIGIFITMQVPVELLNMYGAELGVDTNQEFFWFTGVLSSFLDNAPTYVVFFETAKTLPAADMVQFALTSGVPPMLLASISMGAVFMGAMTYIGNGPNFLVKSVAEQSGVKMPSFFGYMKYSIAVLVPILVLVVFMFEHFGARFIE